MGHMRRIFLGLAGLLVSAAAVALPAYGSNFTSFAEDEDVCRGVGAAAIQGAVGPSAARQYDVAHGQCMAARGRMRWMGAYPPGGAPGGEYPDADRHSTDFPDAFYSIPYATPGYGYDGFSR
jgi:hypothetical protein